VGLGLYLARELIERQGGRIVARSRRNKGTNISIVLPVAQHQVDGLEPDTLLNGITRTAEMSAPVHHSDRVLVVEGRNPLDDSIYDRLEQDGYELHYCTGAQEALNDLKMARFDLVLVDNDQSEVSGIETCRRIRKVHEVPIVLLARQTGAPDESVKALEAGADEYIDSSATTDVIIARIRNIVRRVHLQPGRGLEPLELDGLFIDFANREVYVNNQIISLTRIEYDLLFELVTNRNQLLTHEYLLEKVWGPEFRDENQYLWVNISRLRRKIEPDASKPRYIQTQTGQGYIFRDI
jgi:two-component system, OmpR family, KDP operon response regulator KdpE